VSINNFSASSVVHKEKIARDPKTGKG